MAVYIFRPEEMLYYRVLGRLVRVTGTATNVEKANEYCENHPPASVLAECGSLILLADWTDTGTPWMGEEDE